MKEVVLIIMLQLVYVPLMTLRTIFMVKNMSLRASFVGTAECLAYLFGLSLVFSGEKSTLAMVVYAVGFGMGLYLGGVIERKMALGHTAIVVNLVKKNNEMIDFLREQGFGVTVFEGEGRDSKRFRVEVLAKRQREKELMHWIDVYEPNAFIIAYEPRTLKGGFLVKSMNKKKINMAGKMKKLSVIRKNEMKEGKAV